MASLEDDKAQDIVVIELEGKSSIADRMMIATGQSSRQIGAMAQHIVEKLKSEGFESVPVEGQQQGDWILLDAFDTIVHLFRPEVRDFYNLEKIWELPVPDSEQAAALSKPGATGSGI